MPFMSDKFPRIMHFPFSLGAKNDDRIAGPEWYDFLKDKNVVLTEKLDGQNQALSSKGIFARTLCFVTKNAFIAIPFKNRLSKIGSEKNGLFIQMSYIRKSVVRPLWHIESHKNWLLIMN